MQTFLIRDFKAYVQYDELKLHHIKIYSYFNQVCLTQVGFLCIQISEEPYHVACPLIFGGPCHICINVELGIFQHLFSRSRHEVIVQTWFEVISCWAQFRELEVKQDEERLKYRKIIKCCKLFRYVILVDWKYRLCISVLCGQVEGNGFYEAQFCNHLPLLHPEKYILHVVLVK